MFDESPGIHLLAVYTHSDVSTAAGMLSRHSEFSKLNPYETERSVLTTTTVMSKGNIFKHLIVTL